MHIKLAVHVEIEIAVFTVNRDTLDHELPELHSKTLKSIKLFSYIAVFDLMITLSCITISCNPIHLFEFYFGYN